MLFYRHKDNFLWIIQICINKINFLLFLFFFLKFKRLHLWPNCIDLLNHVTRLPLNTYSFRTDFRGLKMFYVHVFIDPPDEVAAPSKEISEFRLSTNVKSVSYNVSTRLDDKFMNFDGGVNIKMVCVQTMCCT